MFHIKVVDVLKEIKNLHLKIETGNLEKDKKNMGLKENFYKELREIRTIQQVAKV